MDLKQRIAAFVALGKKIANLDEEELEEVCLSAASHNGWFTEKSVKTALEGLCTYLNEAELSSWLTEYDLPEETAPKRVGVVMAGNIPMVGLHDFICVLLSGHKLCAKLSSQDPYLLKFVAEKLIEIEPAFAEQIAFVDNLKEIDAIIATGSDNTARHFEFYFAKYPRIIRKNRTSIAVLNGEENKESLKNLASDVLLYFGLGCRNVSKLYVPKGYDFPIVMEALEKMAVEATFNHKYTNNYDYNKSIYLINSVPHLDNAGLLLTENESLVSPISVLYYETYDSVQELQEKLATLEEKTQCIVSEGAWLEGSTVFGQAQFPHITDYADGVDTMAFLKEL
ncbi:acyl-CoA reductase [Flammeovirgaceae bacterium SG7u.111]|nr:acyl-CoA reductase [Flammeovirgaceae bacterium SG7u.132]WPO36723.1 acyl-CoA reductase [Flammeovirgaceae bacterium SG7u.111]